MSLENYALSNTIRVKEAELEQKKNMLGDMERDLAEKREQLNRTKEKARQLQNEAKKTCGNPEGLSEEKKRVICCNAKFMYCLYHSLQNFCIPLMALCNNFTTLSMTFYKAFVFLLVTSVL